MEHPVLGTLENEDGHYEKLGYTKHPELAWVDSVVVLRIREEQVIYVLVC